MANSLICLASASPRRQALLEQIGVPFRAVAAGLTEQRRTGEAPETYVKRIAAEKAEHVARHIADDEPLPVLAADTAVVIGDEIYGKPRDTGEALAMLATLSGRTHIVLTAVALRWRRHGDDLVVRSEVRFRPTTAAERDAYCRTGEPFDKAGAYAIQGLGAAFVERVTGSFSAVVGLPLCETVMLLRRFGLPAWLGHPSVEE